MKSFLILFGLCALTIQLSAQTRRIAHRSHGGTMFARYDNVDGNYGIPYHIPPPRPMVKIHLESGKDTIVSMDDSLARANYNTDTAKKVYKPVDQKKKIRKVNEMGNVGGKLTPKP